MIDSAMLLCAGFLLGWLTRAMVVGDDAAISRTVTISCVYTVLVVAVLVLRRHRDRRE